MYCTVDFKVNALVISVSYGMRGHTACPRLYFCTCVLSSYCKLPLERPADGTLPGLFPAKRKWHFLRTSLWIFSRTWRWRRLFCFMEFSQITENCLFCLSPLPSSVWSQRSSTHRPEQPPSPTATTVCFMKRYLLLVVDFVLQTMLRRQICSVYIHKSVFERVGSYLSFS